MKNETHQSHKETTVCIQTLLFLRTISKIFFFPAWINSNDKITLNSVTLMLQNIIYLDFDK